MSRSPGQSSAAASSLYCGEDVGEVISCGADTRISDHPPLSSLLAHSSPSDESTISALIDSEPHHAPHPDYLRRCRDRSIDVTARQDSINWILKVRILLYTCPSTYMPGYVYRPCILMRMLIFVLFWCGSCVTQVHSYYNFSPVTAFLSVNYLDRFLSSHSLPVSVVSQ